MMMNIPSVIIHNVGLEIFESYIDNEIVFYLDQKNDNFELDFFKLLNNSFALKQTKSNINTLFFYLLYLYSIGLSLIKN